MINKQLEQKRISERGRYTIRPNELTQLYVHLDGFTGMEVMLWETIFNFHRDDLGCAIVDQATLGRHIGVKHRATIAKIVKTLEFYGVVVVEDVHFGGRKRKAYYLNRLIECRETFIDVFREYIDEESPLLNDETSEQVELQPAAVIIADETGDMDEDSDVMEETIEEMAEETVEDGEVGIEIEPVPNDRNDSIYSEQPQPMDELKERRKRKSQHDGYSSSGGLSANVANYETNGIYYKYGGGIDGDIRTQRGHVSIRSVATTSNAERIRGKPRILFPSTGL